MGSILKSGVAAGLATIVCASFVNAQASKPALSVQTTAGQTTFRIGERIALTLIFSSPNDTEYLIAPCCSDHGDRRGEFDFESLDVAPALGWSARYTSTSRRTDQDRAWVALAAAL